MDEKEKKDLEAATSKPESSKTPNNSNKSLKEKAINIKGKQYVLVSDRLIAFNEMYPQGSIETELVSESTADRVIIKATVTPDGIRKFTGYSQALWGEGYINQTSALENCETSAVGRALAMMGIGVIDSVASVDELNKAEGEIKIYKPKTEDNRPWLSEQQFNEMLKTINKGGQSLVKNAMSKYKMKKIYKEALDKALANKSDNTEVVEDIMTGLAGIESTESYSSFYANDLKGGSL